MRSIWWFLVLGACNGATDDNDDDDDPREEGRTYGDCFDGYDNDGDGAIDCDDAGCEGKGRCRDYNYRDSGDIFTIDPTEDTYPTTTFDGPTTITNFDPPGCNGGAYWEYAVTTQGWTAPSLVNAFEMGVSTVAYRWNEENELKSLEYEPNNRADYIGITLAAGVGYEDYSPGVNALYRCGYHDDAFTASNVYVVRVFDTDGNFSDCGFGIDPMAPPNAKEDIQQGVAWDWAVHWPPSGDWASEFNAGCADWMFQ